MKLQCAPASVPPVITYNSIPARTFFEYLLDGGALVAYKFEGNYWVSLGVNTNFCLPVRPSETCEFSSDRDHIRRITRIFTTVTLS